MKPEEQRIAIAEACGLTGIPAHGQYGYRKREGMPDVAETIPDYLNDLDAMHGVIASQPEEVQSLWAMRLTEIVGKRTKGMCEWKRQDLANATAPQRAEAFLKTIGKWTDQ